MNNKSIYYNIIKFGLANFRSISKQLLLQNCFLCGIDSNQLLCNDCLSDLPYEKEYQQERTLNKIQIIFSYIYPIDKLIFAAKFKENLAILDLLGNLMVKNLQFEPRPDVMIPVPLHPKRLQQRGYNQSVELAKCIKKHTGIPLDYNSCQRIKNNRPQVGLSICERKLNIKNAFRVNRIENNWNHIVLIDDVMTTGSTVKSLAKEYSKTGIKKIDVWCCAKTTF